MHSLKYIMFLFLLAPSVASGLESLTDGQLGEVTAQMGLSLTLDDVILYQSFSKISFVDTDGGDTAKNPFYYLQEEQLLDKGQGAALNLEDFEIDVLRVNAIAYENGAIVNAGEQDAVYNLTTHAFTAKPIVIDYVDKLPILSAGYNYMLSSKNNDFGERYLLGLPVPIPLPKEDTYNRTGISIGFPTIDIYINELNIGQITVTAEDQTNRVSVNNAASMGRIGIKGLDLAILSGLMEFAPHNECGVDFALDDVQMYLKIDEFRFTDTDGISLPNASGGPASLALENIEADLIHMNALTITDLELQLNKLLAIAGSTIYGLTPASLREYVADLIGNYKLTILSTGQDPAHLEDLNNYDLLNLMDVLRSWHGYPILIDATRSLGLTTLMFAANYGETLGLDYYSMSPIAIGGVFMTPGTVEIYMDTLSIGGVTIRDEGSGSVKSVNDGASFFPVSMTGVQLDTLNGNIEISSH